MLMLLAAPLQGQVQQLADSIRADSIRADSLRADSVARRQAIQTDRYLAATARNDTRVPPLPYIGAEGPRASGARIVFTRDSMDWAMAQTLGDLVALVPGSYLWRTGWLGTAALPNYHARGATSVEYFLDGLPYVAAGPDSVSVDPSIFALSLLERVEIEPWPGSLRVYLYSRRYDRVVPRSLIGLGRGTNSLTRFQAQLEKRSVSKLSFGIAGDYYNSGKFSGSSENFYLNAQAWAQLSYVPSPKYGLVAQYVTSSPKRQDEVSRTTGSTVLGTVGGRSDLFLRGFLRKRDDGLGPGLDLTIGRTAFSSDSVNIINQDIWSVTANASWRAPTLNATASAAYRTRWTVVDLGATAGWTPSARVGVNASAVYQLLSGSRSSAWAGAQASIAPFSHVVLRGSARAGSVVQAPSIEADTAQSVFEASGSVGWDSRVLGVEVGIARTSAFSPIAYQETQLTVETIPSSQATNWFQARGRLSPTNWFWVDAWYSSAMDVVPDGQPPEHARVMGTLRSRFLRTFPSGAFDLKASLGFERWSGGTLGLGPGGSPLVLPSQMYLETLIELKIQSFVVYFSRANLLSEVPGYVPGFPVTALATTFGVRWGFLN
ncbi:MAG: hypothetical protein H6Q77_1380 [Gemmatimonadetes bacterium]|nr:hypothetical protein [Gemmatimonadota bacterium]